MYLASLLESTAEVGPVRVPFGTELVDQPANKMSTSNTPAAMQTAMVTNYLAFLLAWTSTNMASCLCCLIIHDGKGPLRPQPAHAAQPHPPGFHKRYQNRQGTPSTRLAPGMQSSLLDTTVHHPCIGRVRYCVVQRSNSRWNQANHGDHDIPFRVLESY